MNTGALQYKKPCHHDGQRDGSCLLQNHSAPPSILLPITALAAHLTMDPVKHIDELVRLINQETENHRITKTLLSQHHSSTQDWERACTTSQAQLHQVQVKLAVAESKNQQLMSENARLNMTINNMVWLRLVSKLVLVPS